jgi:hypothetical protein
MSFNTDYTFKPKSFEEILIQCDIEINDDNLKKLHLSDLTDQAAATALTQLKESLETYKQNNPMEMRSLVGLIERNNTDLKMHCTPETLKKVSNKIQNLIQERKKEESSGSFRFFRTIFDRIRNWSHGFSTTSEWMQEVQDKLNKVEKSKDYKDVFSDTLTTPNKRSFDEIKAELATLSSKEILDQFRRGGFGKIDSYTFPSNFHNFLNAFPDPQQKTAVFEGILRTPNGILNLVKIANKSPENMGAIWKAAEDLPVEAVYKSLDQVKDITAFQASLDDDTSILLSECVIQHFANLPKTNKIEQLKNYTARGTIGAQVLARIQQLKDGAQTVLLSTETVRSLKSYKF